MTQTDRLRIPPQMPFAPGHLWFRSTHAFATALVMAAISAGCVAPMAAVITATPNLINPLAGRMPMSQPVQALLGIDSQFFVNVGPPNARLSISVIEPCTTPSSLPCPPKGTVLVLHGYRISSLWMLGPARELANAGYRTVLVDLRGHGRSSGDWLSYGPREAADLSQVIDALYARGLVVGELGVYGLSYGATTAVHLAGRDSRVNAVVAIAPFDAMRTEVPHYGRTVSLGLGYLIPEPTIQAAISRAGFIGQFNPDEAVASDAIRQASSSILIMHGLDDWLVPPGHGVSIHAVSPEGNQLTLIPGLGHVTIWLDPAGEVSARAIEWFDGHLCAPRTDPSLRIIAPSKN